MNSVETRTLGRSDVTVTRLGLGGGPLAGLFRDVSESHAFETIARAFELGIRLFDTAPLYGHGLSEQRVGQVLAGFERGSYVLCSKVGRVLEPLADGESVSTFYSCPLRFRPTFNFTYDGVMRSLESSLRRLRIDRIDVLYIHDPDEYFEEVMTGAYPALEKLRAAGVVRAIGVAMNQWQMLLRFAELCDFDCFLLAGRYTLLDQSALAQFLPFCFQRQIGVVIGGPFNSGILATGPIEGAKFEYRDASLQELEKVRRIEAVCRSHEVPLKAAALQFPTGHPAVCAIIPGCRSVDELEELHRLSAIQIPAALWETLRRNSLLSEGAPVPV